MRSRKWNSNFAWRFNDKSSFCSETSIIEMTLTNQVSYESFSLTSSTKHPFPSHISTTSRFHEVGKNLLFHKEYPFFQEALLIHMWMESICKIKIILSWTYKKCFQTLPLKYFIRNKRCVRTQEFNWNILCAMN